MSLPDLLAAAGNSKPLPGVFQHFEAALRDWGYLAVGGLVFVEDFGVPVPGETMLIAASLYAGTGRLNIVLVALVGFAAAVLGDNLGYAVGRLGGRRFVERFGKYVFLTPQRLDRGQTWFDDHGGKIVVVARFVEGLRQLNGLIAGTIEMHWAKFVLCNALGAALWVTFWTAAGYYAGDHVETIAHYFTWFAVGLAVVVIAVLVWRVRHHRKQRND